MFEQATREKSAWRDTQNVREDNTLEALLKSDVATGIKKGAYQFGEDLVMGAVDMVKLAHKLCTDDKTQAQAIALLRGWAEFVLTMQFGSPTQKERAAGEALQLLENLYEATKQGFIDEYDQAVKEGKKQELLAKWATMGVLEVATAVLTVTKAAKASKASKVGQTGKLTEAKRLSKVAVRRRMGRTSVALGKKLFPGRSAQFYLDFAKIKGKVVGYFDAMNHGADIEYRISETFTGMRFAEIELDAPLQLQRAGISPPARFDRKTGKKIPDKISQWWALEKPAGVLDAQTGWAIHPSFHELGPNPGSPIRRYAKIERHQIVEIPAMSEGKKNRIFFGEAAGQSKATIEANELFDLESGIDIRYRGDAFADMYTGGKIQIYLPEGVDPSWMKWEGPLE